MMFYGLFMKNSIQNAWPGKMKLADIRAVIGLKQVELAECIGLSAATLSLAEAGKRSLNTGALVVIETLYRKKTGQALDWLKIDWRNNAER